MGQLAATVGGNQVTENVAFVTGKGITNSDATASILASASGWDFTGTPAFVNLTVSGVASLANGAAAAPSLAFTNSTGMGLYRVGSNILGVALAGVPGLAYGATEPTVAAATATDGQAVWVKTANGGASTGATAAGHGGNHVIAAGDGGAAAGSGTGGNGANVILAIGKGGTSGSGTAGKDGALIVTQTSGTTAPFIPFAVLASLSDADATLTVAQVRGGHVAVAAGANDRTLTLPTAAQIVAAIPGLVAGSVVTVSVVNLKAANTVTVAVAAGIVALTGASLVQLGQTARTYAILFTNVTPSSEAASLYAIAG